MRPRSTRSLRGKQRKDLMLCWFMQIRRAKPTCLRSPTYSLNFSLAPVVIPRLKIHSLDGGLSRGQSLEKSYLGYGQKFWITLLEDSKFFLKHILFHIKSGSLSKLFQAECLRKCTVASRLSRNKVQHAR